MELNSKVPTGPIEQAWDQHRFDMKLVNPANKRKYTIIVVGTGLAGASAAASLGELGYNVKCFCYQDRPRRAHSIAAQGGINAAKNYQNDGDSVYRLFYDTIKGGDFRAREANVYRLAQVSVNIIDQCVAQGVPFAREYGGLLANRSFGGAQVSRTFYARGQTGQQLLLGAYQALERQVGRGHGARCIRAPRCSTWWWSTARRAASSRATWSPARSRSHAADAVVLATGGYGNVFYLSTNAKGCNATAIWRAYKRGALFANPCFTQIHPTCIPVSGEYQSKLTLMSESLRNDGRIWVPKKKGDKRAPERDSRGRARLLPRAQVSRASATWRRATLLRARAKEVCDEGRGVGPSGLRRVSRFRRRDQAAGRRRDRRALRQPVRDVRADHRRESLQGADAHLPGRPLHHGRAVGGLQPDEQRPRPVRDRRGELLRSRRQPAGRQRADAGPGRRLLHPALHDRRLPGRARSSRKSTEPITPQFATARSRGQRRASSGCSTSRASARSIRSTASWARSCGTTAAWRATRPGFEKALDRIPELREEFWQNVSVPGDDEEFNQSLEKAGRVADFLELAELMCLDALRPQRILRRPFPRGVPDAGRRGAAQRRRVTATSPPGSTRATGNAPVLHKEPLTFENVQLDPAELQVMNLTLHVWRQKNACEPGQAGDATRRTTSARDMSFLEMLDVVNEELIAEGRGAGRLRPRLPRRDLRHVRLMINGMRARPAARHHRLPAAHAPLQGRRHDLPRAVARQGVPGDQETWWSTAARSTASSPAGGYISVRTGSAPDANAHPGPQGERRTGDGCRGLHRLRRLRGGLPERVGDAVHRAPRSRTSALLPQGQPERYDRVRRDGRADGRGRLRRLHQHRRMRSRLPEGDQPRIHRPHEPRLSARSSHRTAEAGLPGRPARRRTGGWRHQIAAIPGSSAFLRGARSGRRFSR